MFVTRGNKFGNQGDTLIEVLFAVAVFSLIAVGSLSIMNQGTASAERSLEITLVRQQIDAQAETLRYLNASYIANNTSGVSQWKSIQTLGDANSSVGASAFGGDSCASIIPSSGVFVLNTYKATYVDPTTVVGKPGIATTYSQVVYDNLHKVSSVQGIWIQPVRYKGINAELGRGFIDFHIFACWDSPGESHPVTIGTIVRLYEPQP